MIRFFLNPALELLSHNGLKDSKWVERGYKLLRGELINPVFEHCISGSWDYAFNRCAFQQAIAQLEQAMQPNLRQLPRSNNGVDKSHSRCDRFDLLLTVTATHRTTHTYCDLLQILLDVRATPVVESL